MRATSKPFWITVNHTFPTKAVEKILYKHTNNTIRFCHPISVAYTADQVQYKWLSGSKPVGMEDDLQMSQFELQKTFHREVNFTRSSESGKPIGISILRRSLWLQWAPSPCCKLCSYCSATPATFLFRSVLCRIRYDKKCDDGPKTMFTYFKRLNIFWQLPTQLHNLSFVSLIIRIQRIIVFFY